MPDLEEFCLRYSKDKKKIAEIEKLYEQFKDKPFDFNAWLERYCNSDVDIMLEGALVFRDLCLEVAGWCPFTNKCPTLAAFVSHVFR